MSLKLTLKPLATPLENTPKVSFKMAFLSGALPLKISSISFLKTDLSIFGISSALNCIVSQHCER